MPNKPITPPRVSTRSISWADMCHRAWGSDFFAPDHKIYVFGGNVFKDSTDKGKTGVYGVPGDVLLVLDGQQYPDMRDGLLASVGTSAPNNGLGSYQEILGDPRV